MYAIEGNTGKGLSNNVLVAEGFRFDFAIIILAPTLFIAFLQEVSLKIRIYMWLFSLDLELSVFQLSLSDLLFSYTPQNLVF